jgi:tetratricopeptide (TPR) repeat protein
MSFDRRARKVSAEREYFETRKQARTRTVWWLTTAIIVVLSGLTATYLMFVRNSEGVLEQARSLQEDAPFESLRLLEQAIAEANGVYPDAQVMKCHVLGEMQGWRAAERYYDTIESPEASDQGVLLDLAVAANQRHAAWLAAKALDAANHAGPHREQVVRLLMAVKFDLGEKAAVLRLCEELAELAPGDPEPWLVTAGIHHEIEQFPPALRAYKEALIRSPPKQEALRVRFQIAELSMHIGDLETADQHIRILRNLELSLPQVDLAYAKMLRRKGRSSEAKAIAEEIITKEPQFPGGFMLRGQLRFDEGDFRAAVADFQAVSKIIPFDHRAHYKLGQVYQRLQMTAESERHFAENHRLTDAVSQILILGRQLDQNPTSRELRLKLAEQHLVLGDRQSAEHWRRTAESIR